MIRAEPRPEEVIAVIDTREKIPYDLAPLVSEFGTLTTGDYSLKGLQGVVAIERKTLGDFLSCVGKNRERFEREVARLLAYPVRCLVIESSWATLEAGEWSSRITPQAAIGSLLGWVAAGLPVVLAGDRERAGRMVSRLLYIAARRRWREARTFLKASTAPAASAGG